MRVLVALVLLGLLAVRAAPAGDAGADLEAHASAQSCESHLTDGPPPATGSNISSAGPASGRLTFQQACDHLFADQQPSEFRATPLVPGVFSPEDCQFMIDAAERHADAKGGWLTDRHANYAATDFDVLDVPALSQLVYNETVSRIFPLFEEAYSLPAGVMGINEVFIVKYSHDAQSSLAAHTDNSEFSFVLALNHDYDGGGTLFVEERRRLKGQAGDVVLFTGRNRHEGLAVTAGTRYIVVGFLNFKCFD